MKTTRKSSVIAAFLLFALLITVIPAPRAYAGETSGECGRDGDNLTWSYSDGTLTLTVIRGSYAEAYCRENDLDYTYPDAPDLSRG